MLYSFNVFVSMLGRYHLLVWVHYGTFYVGSGTESQSVT